MENKWLVIRTKSNHEQIVADELLLRSFECLLPKIHCNNRFKPLFPGYVFVRTNDTHCNQLQYIRGSCGLLIYNGKPGCLRDNEVESMMGISQKAKELVFHKSIEPGTPIKITSGPFIGLIGLLIKYNEQNYFSISINILGRSVSVNLQNAQYTIIN